MMIGFFLIVVDSTIVTVANPAIKARFDASYHGVIWVTSAYLLTFAAFLLLGGRLGDRYGPKSLYLWGLTLFTGSSLGCGLSESIEALTGWRAVQGVGAALLTPQTFSMVTRMFPPERRGVAMGLWGTTAGVGMFVGPLVGGLMVDALGWQWIFLANVPIGAIGLALAWRLVPALPVRRHRVDIVGVLLSGAAIGLVVFGLQEGEHHEWSAATWGTIACGLGLLAAFVVWQARQRVEPLIPRKLFSHRDFGLSNAGIALTSFAVVGSAVPLMFYLQEVRGLSAAGAGLVTAPMAIATAVLAPAVGRLVDRLHPRAIIVPGFALLATALVWLSAEMDPTGPVWRLLIPLTLVGVAGACTWEPLAVTASRTVSPGLAGAGSAVYNAIRQVGAVLGSASIAALMSALITDDHSAAPSPAVREEPLAEAMSQSILMPALAAALGAVGALFFIGHPHPPNPTFHRDPERNVRTAP